jgi:hypothetical protein
LCLMETGSILIKESVNTYKTSDRVSQMIWSVNSRFERDKENS